jgi:hypothetical protein
MQHFHAAGPAGPRLRNPVADIIAIDVTRPPVPAVIEPIVAAARAF